MQPRLLRRPADGEAAGRPPRRDAARRSAATIDTDAWIWLCELGRAAAVLAAQRLRLGRQPLARHLADAGALERSSTYVLDDISVDAWDDDPYSPTETADEALDRALASWGWPALRAEHRAELLDFAQPRPRTTIIANWQKGPYRAMRQNALLQLIGVCPDLILQ